ncbi:MAG TPA: PP2C family protein-serine/threonine phosphatase [Candidatus Saccharimonadales bacterium]|nr:PP2C family protein-serine/threonine phosphatase [Candidatus Saccharimonadales bacterium]
MMALTEPVPATSRVGVPQPTLQPTIHSVREELDRERRQHHLLQQAIFEAAQIQRRLCAPRELDWRGYEIAGEIFPVRHLSGDFFKVIELGGLLGIAVGDIAGKGFTAGIWLTHLLNLVQRFARSFADPARVAAEINRELCTEQSEPPLTALFFAILDPRTHQLAYCNSGLPAPLVLRGDGSIERLETGGPMLGAIENSRFDSGYLRLGPADMLVAYSDGVTECRDAADQEFEIGRLSAAARAAHGRNANMALFSMLGTVLDFAGSSTPGDDLTLLVLRRTPAADDDTSAQKQICSAPQRKTPSPIRSKAALPRGRGSK